MSSLRTNPRGPASRRGSSLQTWLTLVLVACVLLVGGALWMTGTIGPTTFGFAAGSSTRGLVAVPASPRVIPAFTKVTRDHFWDPVAGQLNVIYLSPRSVTPGMLVKWNDIIGRVLDHEKPAGYVFTESDFLPPGTRPGIVAGIPPGKRAIRVPADKVEGLFGLLPGDRFDLVATLPLDTKGRTQAFGFAGPYAEQMALQAQLTNWQKQATVRVTVQNGVVVEALTTRQIPMYSTTLTQGGITRMRPVQEAVIAVDPDEVVRLTEAMAVDAKIAIVPRSGRPDESSAGHTPDRRPTSPFGGAGLGRGQPGEVTMVEAISGSKRDLTAVIAK